MNDPLLSRGFSLLVGGALSLAVAAGGHATRSLTRDGAIAAVVVGTLVFGLGGWRAAVLLLTFFATSSMLTRWRALHKSHPEHRRGRSAGQVFANGTVAAGLSIWSTFAPSAEIFTALGASLAAATADTWATEVGMLSPVQPRLITTWKRVRAGTSGGISALGTAAGACGAAVIAIIAGALLAVQVWQIWIAGVAAMLIDSVLGATLEQRLQWMDNNAVNFLSTLAAAALALLSA